MWLVAINPTSGRGRGAKLGQEVSNFLSERKLPYKIITGANAVALQKNLSEAIGQLRIQSIQVSAILAVGGDGLIHLTLQIAVPNSIPLVPIPAGTGNDFVRSLGWNLDRPLEPLWSAITSVSEHLDLGDIDGEYFAAIASTGFDSLVNERANQMTWPKGPAKYNVAMAIELRKFKPINYKFEIDGSRFEREAMLIAVANGRSYGGGMLVCPEDKLDDGLFDLMILNPVSKREFVRIFPSVYEGAHISHPKVEFFRAKEVKIEATAVCYADGERIGPMPANLNIAPGALKTWRP